MSDLYLVTTVQSLSPENMLQVYRSGCFPMARSSDSRSFDIVAPERRSVLPLRSLHVSRSLRKKVLKAEFEIRVDNDFAAVIDACSESFGARQNTWINASIKHSFNRLNAMGHAHSVESWKDGEIVGGLYGLAIGGVFCGESMFSRATDASKVALVHLAARLDATGFVMLDSQLDNPHLVQFGQTLISQDDYLRRLEAARNLRPDFNAAFDETALVAEYLSRMPAAQAMPVP